MTNSPGAVNFEDGRIPPLDQRRPPTESGGSAERQAAPSPRKPFLPPLGHRSRGASAAARALRSPGRCRRQTRPAGLAEPPLPLPQRARAPESCVKATPGPQSRSPASPTDCGTSRVLSAPGPSGPGEARGPRPANSAGPGAQEGHRRAGEQPPSLAPDPSRASRQVRALTPGERQPGPSRRQRPDAAGLCPAARTPPTPRDPSPRRSPGPAEQPVARPRPCAPCRLTCAPRRLRTSSPAPRAPSGHAPTPGPGLS